MKIRRLFPVLFVVGLLLILLFYASTFENRCLVENSGKQTVEEFLLSRHIVLTTNISREIRDAVRDYIEIQIYPLRKLYPDDIIWNEGNGPSFRFTNIRPKS